MNKPTLSLVDQILQVEAWIRWGQPADQISQRCAEIAQAYLAQPATSDLHDRDCRTIAELLQGLAQTYRQKAMTTNVRPARTWGDPEADEEESAEDRRRG